VGVAVADAGGVITIVYNGVPPDTLITALPSHNPLHDTLF
jgi:hypothetical protein